MYLHYAVFGVSQRVAGGLWYALHLYATEVPRETKKKGPSTIAVCKWAPKSEYGKAFKAHVWTTMPLLGSFRKPGAPPVWTHNNTTPHRRTQNSNPSLWKLPHAPCEKTLGCELPRRALAVPTAQARLKCASQTRKFPWHPNGEHSAL